VVYKRQVVGGPSHNVARVDVAVCTTI